MLITLLMIRRLTRVMIAMAMSMMTRKRDDGDDDNMNKEEKANDRGLGP